MKKDYCELICILDRSGSMATKQTDAIGGFNEFIETQRKLPGTVSVTIALFNDKYELFCDNVDIKVVENLTDKTFIPCGMTALLDAIGKTINAVGERLSKTKEDQRPEKIIVCIVTDGEENSSQEFDNDKIKKMVKHQQEKYGWVFSYLGVDIDAFNAAGSIGVSGCYTAGFKGLDGYSGVKGVYGTATAFVTDYRSNPSNLKV